MCLLEGLLPDQESLVEPSNSFHIHKETLKIQIFFFRHLSQFCFKEGNILKRYIDR